MTIELPATMDGGKVAALIEELGSRVGLPAEAVERIVVASSEEYSDWVGTLAGNRGWFSDVNHDFLAGKTAKREGQANCSIVLHESVVREALDDSGADLSRYAIGFEMGRAKDRLLRAFPDPEQLDPYGDEFSVGLWAELWGSLVLDEYFAAAHAAPLVTGSIRDEIADMKKESCEASYEGVLDNFIRWKRNQIRDVTFKDALASASWRIMVEQAHMAGVGRAGLPSRPMAIRSANEAIDEAFNGLFGLLEKQWERYPDSPRSEQIGWLTEIWRVLLGEIGSYEFREVEGVDRLFKGRDQLC